ncbi:helix-turn-helix domain-containing protein [Neisseria sp. Dent CA1/247]|uniref:Transcriptional regulator n=2 Tax=Neisseria TaxID=482 RepID=A0A3S4YPW8_9NEIS|nr:MULTISPECIES: helix-turn-helix transcriptional regulator [Neisseria]EGV35857.1 transcriptional regulator, PvuIIC [Neisseria weaveri ATCC 51223]EGV38612.1 transcriptional regulator, PvuIIC [Neisseria weaveri LMG 5135]MDO5068763.1 helix-turn-helix transcriptional regulator [Neisseria zoodegmatis]OSI13933.1 transcriptional regulator [Neisseria dumasiana]OSI34518.1 transcriptional regulator [Neisseria dumasiana]
MEKQNNPHPYRLVFAQNMRQVRRLREISQEELAFEAGISKTYICEIERGSRAVSIDIMGRIADALELPLEELLQRDLAKLGRLK